MDHRLIAEEILELQDPFLPQPQALLAHAILALIDKLDELPIIGLGGFE